MNLLPLKNFPKPDLRSEEHTSELHHSSISYAVFCLKKKKPRSHLGPGGARSAIQTRRRRPVRAPPLPPTFPSPLYHPIPVRLHPLRPSRAAPSPSCPH